MRLSGAIAALAAATATAAWPTTPARRLRSLDRAAGAGVLVRHYVAAFVLASLALVLLGAPLVAVGVPPAALGVARALRRHRSAQVRRLRSDAVVEVVFALAAELRAGRTPAQALESAAASTAVLREALGGAARSVRAGAPAAEPLRSVADLPGCGALAAVAGVWQVTEQAGGAVADVLDRLGHTLDADAADRRSFEALLAGPRASMGLLAALPALGLAMAQSAGARPLRLLLHRPVGWALLAAALLLEAAGLAWSRRLVRGVMRR